MSDNVDLDELHKFSALEAEWWNEKGPLKTLHHLNPTRVQYIASKVALPGKTVLDVGCGGGLLTEALAKKGALVTGIDANQTLIAVAKQHQVCANLSIDYLQTTAEAMSEQTLQFDIVTCLELLEHVPHPESLIQAVSRLTKPGGHCFFSTINRHPKAYLYAILGAEYILKLLPRQTHDYAKFIRPSELKRWAIHAKLHAIEFKGLDYNPLTTHCHLTEDIKINYLFYAQKRETDAS